MFVATKHAEIRLRQRGIALAAGEWLVSYGSSHFDHHRGLVFYFDSRSRAVLRSAIDRDALARYFATLELLRRGEHKRRGGRSRVVGL
jgi:hypothetical protein